MSTSQITIPGTTAPVVVTVEDTGQGQPFLLLHGGAGPRSVRGFADLLTSSGHRRAVVPTHPGFEGSDRPGWLNSIEGLARIYCRMLEELDLYHVVVLGNSIGGWLAAEIAVANPSRVDRAVIVDGTGIDVPEHPATDVSGMSLAEISALSYHNPEAFRVDPTKLPPEAQAVLAGNRATMAVYAGPTMSDPSLRARLAGVAVPTLVVWGDSDGIVGAEYGRAFAEAIPGARFEVLINTGHLPQLESPEKLLALLVEFVGAPSSGTTGQGV
jgi:pimeloyl-ACP methyl ester carboxylesterase